MNRNVKKINVHTLNSVQRIALVLSALLMVAMAAHAEEATAPDGAPPTPGIEPQVQQQADSLVEKIKDRAVEKSEAANQPLSDGKNPIRVNYVPESVKQEIREQVRAGLRADVVQDVLNQAKSEQWGMPHALPDWVNRVSIKGDARLRIQYDAYDNTNPTCPDFADLACWTDFSTVNSKGGKGKAGIDAYYNETTDRPRLRERARVALDAKINDELKAGFRVSTGNTREPVTTNQTLANYGNRYQVLWDLAYLKYDGLDSDRYPWLTLSGGRMPNPWLSTDLVFDSDLAFEGLAATSRFNLRGSDSLLELSERDRTLFATVGAFPLQEIELSKRDKWLFGAQVGAEFITLSQSRLSVAVAYYYYRGITGVRNTIQESHLNDYTAPGYLQKGNAVFDIAYPKPGDTDTNLWALAADYHLADLTIEYDLARFAPHHVLITADVVKNLGFNKNAIKRRTAESSLGVQHSGGEGSDNDPLRARTLGYQLMVSVGWPIVAEPGTWKMFTEYRYVQRDAVLDAFTDSDFHLGGTDAKGWVVGGDYAILHNTWLSLKYMSADAIDGAYFGVDSVQLDLNAKF